MPKRADYKTKLLQEKWQDTRQQLVKGNHVAVAKKYLAALTDPIRVFVTDGLGFGDQMFPVNIIEQLRVLGYKGVIEIIAHQEELKRLLYFRRQYKSALQNVLKLYDVEHLFQADSLKYTTPENFTIHFYDYKYFQMHRDSFAKVEIALFPGLITLVYDSYFPGYLLNDPFSVLNKLTEIAKSKRALFLNFFTNQFFNSWDGIGVTLQLQGQQPKTNFLSHALTYPKPVTPYATVARELLQLQQKQVLLGNMLAHIIKLQEQNSIHTFAIYAVHHYISGCSFLIGSTNKNLHCSNILINLLLGSQLAHAGMTQPLLVLILSPIPDASWQQLLMLRQNATVFLDRVNEQFTPESYNPQVTYVLRLPSIPWKIFDYLFIKSTYPPVYEGVNSAYLLKSYNRRGLPCNQREFRVKIPVADQAELPTELGLVGDSIIGSDFSSFDKRNRFKLYEYLAFIMAKYSVLSHLPKGLPPILPYFHSNGYFEFQFNVTEKLQLPQIGDDRLAYGLALVKQELSCVDEFDPDYCYTFNYLNYAAGAAVKGFSYGLLENVMTQVLKVECRLPENKAYWLARGCEFILNGYLEENLSFSLFLLAVEASLGQLSMSMSNKKWVQNAIVTVLFISSWWPQLLMSLDLHERIYSFLMPFLSVFAHMAGQQVLYVEADRYVSRTGSEGRNRFGLFSAAADLQTIQDLEANQDLEAPPPREKVRLKKAS